MDPWSSDTISFDKDLSTRQVLDGEIGTYSYVELTVIYYELLIFYEWLIYLDS